MENNENFHFTYSASQQQEVENIRKKYLPQEEDNLEQLRRLDDSCSRKATTVSLILGVLGALILGLGMSCVLVWGGVWMLPGIAIGLVGIVTVCLAYPLYSRMLEKERKRVAPEILRLTDELLQ